MNLFLDDIRYPEDAEKYMHPDIAELYRKEKWDIVRTYDDFCKYIETNGLPNIISFDHDLADEHYYPYTHKKSYIYKEKTGYDCAKWLGKYCIENKKSLPKFIVHSMNVIGAENITRYLNNLNKQ